MKIGLYTLTSPLHDEATVNATSASFVSEIEKALGLSFEFHGPDFSCYGTDDLSLIYVRTGGTEGLFQQVYERLEGPILLLTSGKSNSLAASMEILSFLNQQGRSGEIIHGRVDYIAKRIDVLAKVAKAQQKLRDTRLGVIGEPSDWLISSAADPAALAEKLGVTLVDIPISELLEEYHKVDYSKFRTYPSVLSFEEEGLKSFAESLPLGLRKYVEGSNRIFRALLVLVERYSLSGLTLRCFDLLDAVSNTGCLALAYLNTMGIPAGCEGDVPTLVTMAVGNALTGVSGFQANPSRIDPEAGEILFAHCTIPFNMVGVGRYTFNTHFESGIGIAICGDIPAGDATVFKLSGDLKSSFCCEADLLKCQNEANLCRTQAVLKLKGSADERTAICKNYFLKSPIGNHHVVFTGAQKELFDAFVQQTLL